MDYLVKSRDGLTFLGDFETSTVHNISNEKLKCQIDKIFNAGCAVGFSPDTLEQAHLDGYVSGEFCNEDR